MELWNRIKAGLKRGSQKVIEVSEELSEKGKKAGGVGLENIKDLLSRAGQKTSDVTSVAKLKIEVASLQKNFDLESLALGRLILMRHQAGDAGDDDESLLNLLKKMLEMEKQIQSRNLEYDQLRKTLSDDYVVNKLSEDLAASDAIIDQVIVSEKSNVVDKVLKEVLLPKEVLISAVKRGEEVIIPDGNTRLQVGDQITLIGKIKDVEKIAKRLTAS